MTYYSISALFIAFVSLLLGLFVLYKDHKKRVNKYLSLWCVVVFVWSFFYFLWQISTDSEDALMYTRLLMFGAIWVPVVFFKVAIIFLKIEKEKRFIYYISAFFAAIYSLLLATPLMVARVEPSMGFLFWPKPGPVFHIFLFMFIGLILYSVYLTWDEYKKEKSELRKSQIKLMLFGIVLSIAGGSTNYFLWYDIPIKPYGNILVFSYVFLTAYAILKYHLLNIKIITAQLVSLIVLIVSLVQVVSSKTSLDFVVNGSIFIALAILIVILVHNMEKEYKRKEDLQLMAEKLAQANDQLRRLDNAKTEFISIASHQLRTPLTSIKGFISLIIEGSYGEINPVAKEALRKTYVSSERLIQLVEDLLNVSRIESGRMQFSFEESDINVILKDLYENFLLVSKEKGLQLELKLPKNGLPPIIMDDSKIREVISNLTDNALKYTEKGGVSIEAVDTGKGTIRIVIADSGIGVPAEEIPRLFKKFSRGKDTSRLHAGGTGLGLYVGKNIIDAHHGKIWVESDGANKGSKFIIELPIEQPAS